MAESYLDEMLEDDPSNFEALSSQTSTAGMQTTDSPLAAKRQKLSNISGTSFADFVASSSRPLDFNNIKEECSLLQEELQESHNDQEELEDETISNSGQLSPANEQETGKSAKHVEFPFLLASTDKGNVMLVTESQTPGFRHHWSLHSRRPQKEEGQFLERFACINCKKLSRQTQSSSFAPCLTLMVQQSNKEIHLLNHPWTSTRPHLCSGVHIDVSDACVLVRQKRRQITYSDSDPKLGFDEIMQEIDTNPNWSVTKKRAVKALVGSRQKNERTFVRCRAKGRSIKSQSKQGPSNCSILDGDFSFEQFNSGYFERQLQQHLNESVFQERQDVGEQAINEQLSANQILQQWAEETGMSMAVQSPPLVDNNHLSNLHNNHYELATTEFSMDSEEMEGNCSAMVNFSLANGSASSSRSVELRDQKRENKNKSKRSVRQINFSSYPQRRIALLFLYTGWNYEGLVFQDCTQNTVEEHIMRVLENSMLVNTREAAQWTRCGRTDKGVSAFRQVAAVTLRSTDTSADGIFWSMDSDPATRVKSTNELPYVKILNGNLPKSIRILAWCPTHRDFNARFNCQYRTYTYVFPKTHTNLALMNDACSRLVGSHDFRNFCQIDKNRDRVQMCYLRKIFEAKVEEVTDQPLSDRSIKPHLSPSSNPYSLVKLTVKASSFLWHQIRCIVTLLYEIGVGRESSELISQLLDVEKTPARPQYMFSNTLPLCLFDCSYPDGDLQWIYNTNVLKEVIMDLQKTWAEHQIKANILRSMISGVSCMEEGRDCLEESIVQGLEDFTIDHPQPKSYIPIMKRPKCMSLEQRKKDMIKKQSTA